MDIDILKKKYKSSIYKLSNRKTPKEDNDQNTQEEKREQGESVKRPNMNPNQKTENRINTVSKWEASLNINKKPNVEFRNQKTEKIEKAEKLFIMPLGGVEEVGKNIMLYQYRDEIVIVDVGVNFPEEGMLGIDLVIPDFTYVLNNIDKVKAILLTHGHEDHIGALPYLFKNVSVDIPIYGSNLTIELAKEKFKARGTCSKDINFKKVKGREKIKFGKYFQAEFVKITHSIPDAFSIAIHTPLGVVVQTGDFKVDLTPVNDEVMDIYKFAELGEKGVLVCLSDSTNAEREGYTISEKKVKARLQKIISDTPGRLIVATFATNIHRIQQVIEIAILTNRKVILDGRSMHTVVEIASRLGYLGDVKELNKTIVDLRNIGNYKDNEILVLCTGTQGEPLSALSRIAKKMHKQITLKNTDRIIISANPIPGNERAVYKIIDMLLESQADVVYEKTMAIHASGHASQQELKLMLNLLKPKFFIPVHGEYHHLKKHKELALELNIPEENILIPANGMKIELSTDYIKNAGKVKAGEVFVDGLGIGDVGEAVIKARQDLSEGGIFIILLKFNQSSKELALNPEIITKGFIYNRTSNIILQSVIDKVNLKITEINGKKISDSKFIKSKIKDVIDKTLYNQIKRNTVVIPIFVEVS